MCCGTVFTILRPPAFASPSLSRHNGLNEEVIAALRAETGWTVIRQVPCHFSGKTDTVDLVFAG